MVGVSAVEVRVRGCLMCLMSVARRLQIEDSEVEARREQECRAWGDGALCLVFKVAMRLSCAGVR